MQKTTLKNSKFWKKYQFWKLNNFLLSKVWCLIISKSKIYQGNSKKTKKKRNSCKFSQIHNGGQKMQKNTKFKNFGKKIPFFEVK